MALTNELAKKAEVEIDEKLIQQVAFQAQGDLSPMVAVFGGWGAQEVLKAVSGKFGPTFQWLYFDSLESLPSKFALNEETCKPVCSLLNITNYRSVLAMTDKSWSSERTSMKDLPR